GSQCAGPTALAATRLMMHVLSELKAVFGIGRGGPKRQSLLVQFRLLPVSVEVRLASVRSVPLQHTLVRLEPMSGTVAGSGTASAAPPKSRPAQVRDGTRPPRAAG